MALMQKPLTMDDYLTARMIADPMCLFDCCLESDGSLACVITSAERARDLRQRPAYIHAAAQGMGPNASVMTNYYKADFLTTSNAYVARDLWTRSDIQARDVRCAQLYDAFTPLIMVSLEEFGFVEPGEAGPFALAGNLQWPHGRLPTNTSGGSLSEAYVHGFNLICEGVRQIRGTSTCQVPDCDSVLVTSGAGVPNGAVLLRR
jgi:acetyl-CoA acetyltransferase